MMAFLAAHGATIIVCAILLLIVGLIIVRMVRNKKQGKSMSGCSCGCGGCAMNEYCHPAQPPKTNK